ncbi:hypothetical protein CERSUDRAFT_74545 [Gelatoporia subvermispora B]|uniref:F-box domain-containing protein n=1 Tax=Ceriporiopsis subvermispora (strain B) TaxID=914234 RepID=M2RCU7_CERS8|nr:hypothetical protein CERSUDRAFT_74545 [Gelatoporia subvermispora B]
MSTVPPLAIELYEDILNFLWDDLESLCSCALVCSVWLPRCRYHLQAFLRLHRRAEINNIASKIHHDEDLRRCIVRLTSMRITEDPIDLYGHVVPYVLASTQRRVPAIIYHNVNWISLSSKAHSLICLSPSLRVLTLSTCRLRTFLDLYRVLRSSPYLANLYLIDVQWDAQGYTGDVRFSPGYGSSLKTLVLRGLSSTNIRLVASWALACHAHTIQVLDMACQDDIPDFKVDIIAQLLKREALLPCLVFPNVQKQLDRAPASMYSVEQVYGFSLRHVDLDHSGITMSPNGHYYLQWSEESEVISIWNSRTGRCMILGYARTETGTLNTPCVGTAIPRRESAREKRHVDDDLHRYGRSSMTVISYKSQNTSNELLDRFTGPPAAVIWFRVSTQQGSEHGKFTAGNLWDIVALVTQTNLIGNLYACCTVANQNCENELMCIAESRGLVLRTCSKRRGIHIWNLFGDQLGTIPASKLYEIMSFKGMRVTSNGEMLLLAGLKKIITIDLTPLLDDVNASTTQRSSRKRKALQVRALGASKELLRADTLCISANDHWIFCITGGPELHAVLGNEVNVWDAKTGQLVCGVYCGLSIGTQLTIDPIDEFGFSVRGRDRERMLQFGKLLRATIITSILA